MRFGRGDGPRCETLRCTETGLWGPGPESVSRYRGYRVSDDLSKFGRLGFEDRDGTVGKVFLVTSEEGYERGPTE